jgi:YfiH family protein
MNPMLCNQLASHTRINHGFFTRQAGVSEGIYASLNCGTGSNDDPTSIQENRRRVADYFNQPVDHLLSLYQIHSNQVITIAEPFTERPKADAMVTNQPGIILGILTADCAPILFHEPHTNIIGAAHAGWKGAVGGVIENTISAMQALGASIKHIVVTVGPSIAQSSYEVGQDMRNQFPPESPHFAPGSTDNKYQFDLSGFVASRLQKTGIQQVNLLANDTYSEEDAFFSYRRTTHRGETDYGRHISAIMIKED